MPKAVKKNKTEIRQGTLHKTKITNDDSFVITNTDERSFSVTKIANRIGQSHFRKQLIDLWKGCSISGCKTLSALDAAHIAPYRGEKDNDIRNGLLLRADLHRLFDAFLISINPDNLTVHISPKISDPTYNQFEGVKIQLEEEYKLSEAALQYHWFYFSNSEE